MHDISLKLIHFILNVPHQVHANIVYLIIIASVAIAGQM